MTAALVPEWRNGRRTSLRSWREQSHGGSSPLSGTSIVCFILAPSICPRNSALDSSLRRYASSEICACSKHSLRVSPFSNAAISFADASGAIVDFRPPMSFRLFRAIAERSLLCLLADFKIKSSPTFCGSLRSSTPTLRGVTMPDIIPKPSALPLCLTNVRK